MQAIPTQEPNGLFLGFVGVLAFSLTIPLTRMAVQNDGMSALFAGSARAVVAAILAAIVLVVAKQARPVGRQWLRVALVAAGVVIGFPLLTSYALADVPASHGAVVIAILPAATAVVSALRTRERPATLFWFTAGLGAVAAVAFAAVQGHGFGGIGWPDLLLFAAVAAAAVGYAEGGMLSRELGAWQTVCWALVVASPLMIFLTAFATADDLPRATAHQWLAFAYLAVVSMFLSFFAWFRGLAIGPMTSVSQVQLVQPVLSIAWAVLILHEQLDWKTALGSALVILTAACAIRVKGARSPARPVHASSR